MRAGGARRLAAAGWSLWPAAGWRGALASLARFALFAAAFMLVWTAAALGGTPLAGALGLGPLVAQGGTMLFAATVVGWAMLARLDGRDPAELGFAWSRAAGPALARGGLIGLGMLGVVVAMLVLGGWLSYRAEAGGAAAVLRAWTWGALALSLPAAAEEALFRGYGFQVLVRGLGALPATVLLSGVFAWAHGNNPAVDAFALVNIFLAGVLLSVAFLWTGSLWFATGLHLAWNWAMASLADLPVSGLTFLETPRYEPVLRGPEWVTGGAFGPEAGVVGTAAFLLGLAGVLAWGRPRGGTGQSKRGESE